MNHRRFYEDGRSFYSVQIMGNFEYADPVEKLIETVRNVSVNGDSDMLLFLKTNPQLSHLFDQYPSVVEKFVHQNSLNLFQSVISKVLNQKLPPEIYSILESSSKNEQSKILKGIALST